MGYLYEQVVLQIKTMIEKNIYAEGDKLPSIRVMSNNLKVSINTIKEAYSILEIDDVIEGRSKVGYFVKKNCSNTLPILHNPVIQIATENLDYQHILNEVMDPEHIPLGAAVASPSLMPVQDFSILISSLSETQKKQCLSYAPTEGLISLRRSIIGKLVDSGLSIREDEIVITSGCEEALFLALSAITKPGDSVAIQSPVYCNLVLMFKNLGLNIIEIPSNAEDGISIDALKYAMEFNTIKACLVISNFNNPSGSIIPDINKKLLAEILSDKKIPLIEDDVYGDLYFEGNRPTTCRSYDSTGNTILCSSFSKTISPGLRVGYIIPGKFKNRVIQRKMSTNICTSTISQLLLTNYLESGGFHRQLRKLRNEVSSRMSKLRADVKKYFPDGTNMTDPKGGYTLWVELPGNVSGLDLYTIAIKEGIAIVPGGLFSQKKYFENFIRIDAGCYTDDIVPAVKRLGEMVMHLLFI
ncbi:MAG: PLP-dependent aminotransferase family protein [Spirochaetaceae bacterium]